MNCLPAQRSRANRAASVLEHHAAVVAVDVLAPADSRHDRWTVEVTWNPDRGVPPVAGRVQWDHRLYGQHAGFQADHPHVVLTA